MVYLMYYLVKLRRRMSGSHMHSGTVYQVASTSWSNRYIRIGRIRVGIIGCRLSRNVSSLPKDELGSMAEALVNLTKFRRRVSQERETVGGPIDVAVITKGDGFVWVKRKHYFDPRLNPRTMAQFRR